MKSWTLLTLILITFSVGAFFSSGIHFSFTKNNRPPTDGIHWERSLESSLLEAKAKHRMVFVDFYADWCSYCKQMDAVSYQDPKVVKLSEEFICTKVNVDKEKKLAQEFQVDGLPTLVFMEPSTGKMKRFEGYLPPSSLVSVMNKLANLR